MLDRRHALLGAAAVLGSPRRVAARPAEDALNELGTEDGASRARVGSWTVTETRWAAPGAVPTITTGLVAERRMIGTLLQETIRSAHDPNDVKRIDYLKYDRVEGRWDYVSLEVRIAVGIMPAWSYGPAEDGRITLIFQPFAVAGSGDAASGRMLRMRQIIDRRDEDRDSKDQFFAFADGGGHSWLAHRYAYVRQA